MLLSCKILKAIFPPPPASGAPKCTIFTYTQPKVNKSINSKKLQSKQINVHILILHFYKIITNRLTL